MTACPDAVRAAGSGAKGKGAMPDSDHFRPYG